eukprot:2189612-Pyramimonas_sp.AAC.1
MEGLENFSEGQGVSEPSEKARPFSHPTLARRRAKITDGVPHTGTAHASTRPTEVDGPPLHTLQLGFAKCGVRVVGGGGNNTSGCSNLGSSQK